jgi:hypothetical protein
VPNGQDFESNYSIKVRSRSSGSTRGLCSLDQQHLHTKVIQIVWISKMSTRNSYTARACDSAGMRC